MLNCEWDITTSQEMFTIPVWIAKGVPFVVFNSNLETLYPLMCSIV